MKKTHSFLLAAGFLLAMAFVFSCGLTGELDGGQNNAGTASVSIGDQIWLKRNLDVVPTGENVATNSRCYEDEQTNCEKYGRLYDWATAMKLPEDCNNVISPPPNIDCTINAPYHQGLCPDGYHIPTDADWDELLRYIDDDTGGNGSSGPLALDTYVSLTAGYYLKATKGWDNYNEKNGNGIDAYGFTALPGGTTAFKAPEEDDFDGIGDAGRRGCFWGSTLRKSYGYYRCIVNYDGWNMYGGVDANYHGISVRCVKDYNGTATPSSSSNIWYYNP